MDMDNGNGQARFDALLREMRGTYVRKNHDYGSSFSKTFEEFGMVSAVVRMSDKMERLKTLTKSDAEVGESVRDTLMDLANYAVLTVMELDRRTERDAPSDIEYILNNV